MVTSWNRINTTESTSIVVYNENIRIGKCFPNFFIVKNEYARYNPGKGL